MFDSIDEKTKEYESILYRQNTSMDRRQVDDELVDLDQVDELEIVVMQRERVRSECNERKHTRYIGQEKC